jgi:excisionase family DNA binding protein
MGSNSRRARVIDVGFREASLSEGGRARTHELSVGATPSIDASQEHESNLPTWVSERYAAVSNSIPREVAQGPESPEEFMTVAEAASVLRISERTVSRHLSEGRIPHIRAGKQIRIPRAALLRGWKKE